MSTIENSKLIEIIKHLVAFKSVSSGSDEIKVDLINYIERYVQEFGLKTYKFYENGKPSMVVYHPDKKDFRYSLLLHGHIDVVHGHENQYEAVFEDGLIHGRGALDMKGSVAVFLLLMIDLLKDDKLPLNLGLMITSDEEQGGINGTKHLFTNEGINADFFITGEPTDLHIVNKHKGVWRSSIKVLGTSAHSSTPWLGDNSLHKSSKYISDFINSNPPVRENEWKSTYSFNKIDSGDSLNKIPEETTVGVDVRYTTDDELNKITESIKKNFPNSIIDVLFTSPPLYTEVDHKMLLRLNEGIESVVGTKSEILSKEYATDARYASMQGIPSIVFGPSGKGIHEEDEYVELESLIKYYEILWRFCINFE